MHPIAFLQHQHRRIEQLFAVIQSSEDDVAARLVELAAELPAHIALEHACLYPLATRIDSRGVAEAFEEHAIIAFALRRLLITTIGTEPFRARVSVLKEMVEKHVEEEEASLFPQLERSYSADVLARLGEEMTLMHRALLEQAPAPTTIRGVRI